MIKIRILKESGIDEFRKYLEDLRLGKPAQRPDLNTNTYSSEFMPALEINEHKSFETRVEMGKYLAECFSSAGLLRENMVDSVGLWSWLAYIWFDQITANGKKIRANEKYICMLDYQHYYRHLVAMTYNIYSLYGEENSKLFLGVEPYEVSDMLEQVASRQDIISSKKLVEVLNILYWDSKRNAPKIGATGREGKPGNVRRFIKVIYQLSLTYDLDGVASVQKTLDLLPKDFGVWKKS